MTLWVVPLERFEPEDRYTTQVHRWFLQKFKEKNIDYSVIEGQQLTKTIEHGEFLDTYGTIYYKSSQIQEISKLFRDKKVKNGDTFFVYDFEFPGLEAIRYMAKLSSLDIKIYAWCHAGSYTYGDFMKPCQDFAKYFEVGWWKICDGIFVGSEYHKSAIIERRLRPMTFHMDYDTFKETIGKIHVTGNPWNSEEVWSMVQPLPEKENIIIFPHRLAIEKRPDIFLINICLGLYEKLPEVKFLLTTARPEIRSTQPELVKLYYAVKKTLGDKIDYKVGLSKQEYYYWMAKSKVMFSSSKEENFGYTALEAMTFNTMPLVPNNFSYPELLDKDNRFLYSSLESALKKLPELLSSVHASTFLNLKAQKYDTSIDRMIKIMES